MGTERCSMQQLAFTSIQDLQEESMVLLNVTNYLALLGTPSSHFQRYN